MVIVLHSLLPHQHHDEMAFDEHEIEHKEADSLLDYIRLIFHEDMGEAHLEHVVVGQFLSLDMDADFSYAGPYIELCLNSQFTTCQLDTKLEGLFSYLRWQPQRLPIQAQNLRGPPSLI